MFKFLAQAATIEINKRADAFARANVCKTCDGFGPDHSYEGCPDCRPPEDYDPRDDNF